MLVQLEKNQEVLPSRPDEALFHQDISREITTSLFNLERVLTFLLQLKKFSDIPVSTRKEH